MNKNIYIIGSGFSSMAASCYMAKKGYKVTVLEKNNDVGGRARQIKKDGFTYGEKEDNFVVTIPLIEE